LAVPYSNLEEALNDTHNIIQSIVIKAKIDPNDHEQWFPIIQSTFDGNKTRVEFLDKLLQLSVTPPNALVYEGLTTLPAMSVNAVWVAIEMLLGSAWHYSGGAPGAKKARITHTLTRIVEQKSILKAATTPDRTSTFQPITSPTLRPANNSFPEIRRAQPANN